MDAGTVQTIIVIGVMVSMFGIIQLQLRSIREDMRRDRQEIKNLIIGHFHPDGDETVFRLPQSADD